MRVTNSLRFKYVVITLIAFGAIAVSIFYFTTAKIRGFILSGEQEMVSSHIQTHAAKNLNLDRPESLKFNNIYQGFISSISEDEGLTNLKLIDGNGILIYSPQETEVGQNFLNDGNVQKALKGEVILNQINESNSAATITTPLKNSKGEVRGVVIATMPLTGQLKQVDTLVFELAGIVGIVSLFFAVVLYFVFSNAETTLLSQDRTLMDKTRALEEEQQLDEAIMNSVAESLVVINKDGQIMLFNTMAEQLTGLKSNDVEYRLYRKILKFSDKDGHEYNPNPITKCLSEGKIIKLNIKDEVFIKDEKNNLAPVSVSVAPIFGKEHKITGVVATLIDIKAEKELDKVKDEFVYVVAHELGNPIFALDGYLSILATTLKKSDKKSLDILASAQSVHSQLSNLVNDLLEAIRNENSQISFEITPINLNLITKEIVDAAGFKAQTKKIKLNYTESKQPLVLGNEQKIKEVMTNFVDNAIKYTPEGGQVEVWHKQLDDFVVTSVKDNGYGISNDAQKHLFEKFYRIKTEKTQGIPGTGLGLFICRQIVEKCGGKIWAHSEEGKGSIFSFGLKAAKNINKK